MVERAEAALVLKRLQAVEDGGFGELVVKVKDKRVVCCQSRIGIQLAMPFAEFKVPGGQVTLKLLDGKVTYLERTEEVHV